MRREDERRLTAQELGKLVESVAREPREAVETVRIDDKRHLALEQRGDDAHGAAGHAHAGAHENGGAALGELGHLGAGLV